MLILNMGVPRSGTVLVNALIRGFLQGIGVRPVQRNPVGPEVARLIEGTTRSGTARHHPVILHFHTWDNRVADLLPRCPEVVAFANYRDPRDICVSLRRLHDLPLDEVARSTVSYFEAMERAVAATGAMVVPYEHLLASTEGLAFQIARSLGLWPGLDVIERVVENASLERHRDIMEKVARGEGDLLERQNRKRVLREDRETLINDRHIQSGAAGRWREELSEEEQQMLNDQLAPLLKRYGYA